VGQGERQMTSSNAEIVKTIKAHHLQMTTTLKSLTDQLIKNFLSESDQYQDSISDKNVNTQKNNIRPRADQFVDTFEKIIEFVNFELKPHALAEELYLYPKLTDQTNLDILISSMTDEHRELDRLITNLTTTSLKKISDIERIAICYSISVLFNLHAEKEDKFIAKEVSTNNAINAKDILNNMHSFLNEYVDELKDNVLDVRTMPPAMRHETIFSKFENLKVGKQFLLINDHDPKPLYYQFKAEYSGQFGWEYLMSGPKTWQVKIQKTK
jgi:uncharacterized protein (DUF2249 family)/hemerythrin superfamily protein